MNFLMGSMFTLSLLLVGGESLAATDVRNVLVTGQCLRSVAPDRGMITVTASVLENDLSLASKKSTESYERVRTNVEKLSLKNLMLQTSEYSFQEEKEWTNNKQVFKGFRARMGLQVSTSDISRLGEVISIAAKEGLREVGSLQTFMSPAKAKLEKELCLEEAVKNARAKAEAMAKAAGVKVGRVLEMSEEVRGPSEPVGIRHFQMKTSAMGADEMAASAPSIDAANQNIEIKISARFVLE